MDTRASARLVPGFIARNGIDLRDYEKADYASYNAFFTRKLSPSARPIAPCGLMSPCDAKLSVYPIDRDSVFSIKQSRYAVAELLNNRALAEEFLGGVCLIFRLSVDDYHRYCYFDDGVKGDNVFLPGVLHTVQPIALTHCNIYKRNCREYTVLETEHFGRAVQVEVGAMLVGKIQNHHGAHRFRRGEEKGYFEYGGSTIVLLLSENAATIDPELLENTRAGLETVVRYGEQIGTAYQK